MALDRFICWSKQSSEKPPTTKALRSLIENYLGDALKELTEDETCFFVKLHGKPRFPFRDLGPDLLMMAAAQEQRDERWFEVNFVDLKKNIDVITRQGDEYTDVVAQGFAELVARFYETKVRTG